MNTCETCEHYNATSLTKRKAERGVCKYSKQLLKKYKKACKKHYKEKDNGNN